MLSYSHEVSGSIATQVTYISQPECMLGMRAQQNEFGAAGSENTAG